MARQQSANESAVAMRQSERILRNLARGKRGCDAMDRRTEK